MNRSAKQLSTAVLLVSLSAITACSWVKVDEGAANIPLVKKAHLVNCKKVGTAETSVKHKIMGIKRSRSKVAGELLNLARNEAHYLGGNTLLALTEVYDGGQQFAVYKCPE